MPLGPNQQAAVASASIHRLRREFESVARQWPRNRWLSSTNRYARDTTEQIEVDTAGAASIAELQLGRYIAASVVVHCMDGWSYVARALESALASDPHAATHLAYYAELRAAMSLLAAGGVGVFDGKNFVLTADGECKQVNGGTHTFAWDALSHWATLPAASDMVLDVIQPGGLSLDHWLQHFPATPGAALRSQVIGKWLLNWGVDLQAFAEDREARNHSSYRPTSIPVATRASFFESLEFFDGFWSSFEPISHHPFRVLDRYLLRRSMVQGFKASNGNSPRRAPHAYMRFVRTVLHAVAPGDLTIDEWEAFLDVTKPKLDIPLIVTAEQKAPIESPRYHLQVIARAAMLLRVATGACRAMLLQVPASDRANLKFWWHALGEDRNFWDAAAVPTNLSDLWVDVEIALQDARDWQASAGTRRGFFASKPIAARTLSTSERIPIWSLGV